MRINATRRDTIWSYIGIALSMGVNLILLPLILLFLNDNDVGLYYVFVSLSAVASLFDFGFSPSVARSMAYAWSGAKKLSSTGCIDTDGKEPNYELITKIITACKFIYRALAIAALVLGASIGTYYINAITQEYQGYSHFVAWGVYAVAIALNLLYGYYLVFLRGIGAVAEANKATVIARSVHIIACVTLLLCGAGIIGVSIAYLLYGISFRLIAKRMFYKRLSLSEKQIRDRTHNDREGIKSVVRTIWPNTWREGLITLSDYMLNQSTTIIASLYLSLKETGIYSVSVQLTTAVATIAMALFTSYQPTLQSAYANRDTETQKRSLSAILLSFVSVYCFGIIALLTVGRPIISIVKPSYEININLLICVGLYQFIRSYRNCYCSFISTTNRVIYTKAFVVSSCICVGASLLLTGVLKFGTYGLVIAQIVSQLIYNAWRWPMYVHKQLKLSFKDVMHYGIAEIKRLLLNK